MGSKSFRGEASQDLVGIAEVCLGPVQQLEELQGYLAHKKTPTPLGPP